MADSRHKLWQFGLGTLFLATAGVAAGTSALLIYVRAGWLPAPYRQLVYLALALEVLAVAVIWAIALAPRVGRGIRRILRALTARVVDKGSYRFSLSALLLAVLLIAVTLAWFGYRARQIAREGFLLEGKWHVVNEDATPVLVAGKPVIVEIAPGRYTIDPLRNPKWLDFHTARGVSHAIYRWEGDRVRVLQISEGLQRPNSFNDRIEDIGVKPRTAGSTQGMSTYLLERLPN
jgi:hypothetical protein